MRLMSRIQPSIRDSELPVIVPGIETLGYFREVPSGLRYVTKNRNCRKAVG